MSDSMQENQPIKNIKKQFSDETKRAINKQPPPGEKLSAIDAVEYAEAFTGYEKEMLGPDVLYKALHFFSRNWNAVKGKYLPGDTCCLTAIPVTDMGVELDEKAMKNHQYLRLLSVSAGDGLTREFSFYPARYFELMPEIIRKDIRDGGCSFIVEKDDPSQYGKSQGAFMRDYRIAFNNLRKFFGLPPIEEALH